MGDNMIFMRKIITGIILCLVISGVNAQQTYQYRYAIFDNYLLNPGYVGSKDYYPVLVGRDQRFYGLSESSPQTYFLSLHSKVGKGYVFKKDGKINEFFSKFGNLALGLQFTQYQYGPERETNIGMTYGYHLDLKQSYITRNPRKLVLALTPRLQHIWYNRNDLYLVQDESMLYTDNLSKYSSWVFSSDVGALYQTVHFDMGFAALNFLQTKNKLESEFVLLPTGNDSIPYESVSTKDLLYPPKLLINGKLKFIDIYTSEKLDLYFIPSFTAFYVPKRNYTEFYLDLMLENTFKKTIAGIRKEIIFTGQVGLNIHHRREYDPMTLFQPYVSFDFKNYAITYAHSFYIGNDLVKEGAAIGGNQISLLFKISRDRIYRESQYKKKKFD
jgi:hypothetical protein